MRHSIISPVPQIQSVWGILYSIQTTKSVTDYDSLRHLQGSILSEVLYCGGIELDYVSAKVEDYDSRIYFWDVNLPGEMRSTMYSKDASSVGVKVVYNTKHGWYSGIRYRIKWEENSITGLPTSSAGVFIRASV